MIREKNKLFRALEKAVSFILILPVRFYQKFISPCYPPCCKYYPSCSRYAVEALMRHGPLKGSVLAGWRILRCNPWSRGGVDYVPEKFDLLYYKKKGKQENN